MTDATGTPRNAANERAPASKPNGPELWAPRLRRIVSQQRELYEQLDALSRSQSDLIRSGLTDDLIGVLGERQRVLERLTNLNEEVAPFVDRWDELAPMLAPAQRKDLRGLFDEVSRLVQSISARDESDRVLLEEQRAVVGRELAGVTAGRGAVQAYASRPRESGPRFQDREG